MLSLVSSRNSRLRASSRDSPCSTFPPGRDQRSVNGFTRLFSRTCHTPFSSLTQTPETHYILLEKALIINMRNHQYIGSQPVYPNKYDAEY